MEVPEAVRPVTELSVGGIRERGRSKKKWLNGCMWTVGDVGE